MKRIPIPIAREIMTRRLHTIPAESDLASAVQTLVAKGHSGAPVVDASGALVGVLSESDCTAVLAEAALEGWPTASVADRMTKQIESVPPDMDILALSSRFGSGHHRRLIVLDEDSKLIGLITRETCCALSRIW